MLARTGILDVQCSEQAAIVGAGSSEAIGRYHGHSTTSTASQTIVAIYCERDVSDDGADSALHGDAVA
jgi:hypothetical protein